MESILISGYIIHEKYNRITKNHDIALLKLALPSSKEGITLLNNKKINEYNLKLLGRNGFVLGWGRINPNFVNQSEQLQKVELPLQSSDVCKNIMKATEFMICAGDGKNYYDDGRDACFGDSGGPLIVKNNLNNKFTQIGIVSWGYGCAEESKYGVYTDVGKHFYWITEKASEVKTNNYFY